MRGWLAVFFLLLTGCAASVEGPAAVDPASLPAIGGVLSEDLVLSGDYLLRADLQVPTGITLTIQAGSRIYIQPSDSTKIDPEYLSREIELLVRGRLLALGTAERPIRFVPLVADPAKIAWAGIELVGSRGTQLRHLLISQADVGLLCLGASPLVDGVQILRSRYGIILQQGCAPQITDSLLADGEGGLFCWDESAPQVQGSQILRQEEEGIYLSRQCRGRFIGNRIAHTDRAWVLPAGAVPPEGNQLLGNRLEAVHYPSGGAP